MEMIESFFANYKQNLKITIEAFDRLMSRNIPDEDAIEFIRYFQMQNSGAQKSVWMDDAIIRVIAGNQNLPAFSGLRLYYAKYKEGVGEVGRQGGPQRDELTIVVAITRSDGNQHKDIPGKYFDYSRPCPPNCNGGIEIITFPEHDDTNLPVIG